jgi:dimethylglycine dehydrogenase
MEQLPGIYDALSAAGPKYGLRDFGLYAMDSLRLDKGYRGWKTDIETGYLPYEASLDRFVSLEKPAFVGREALIREAERGVAKSRASYARRRKRRRRAFLRAGVASR